MFSVCDDERRVRNIWGKRVSLHVLSTIGRRRVAIECRSTGDARIANGAGRARCTEGEQSPYWRASRGCCSSLRCGAAEHPRAARSEPLRDRVAEAGPIAGLCPRARRAGRKHGTVCRSRCGDQRVGRSDTLPRPERCSSGLHRRGGAVVQRGRSTGRAESAFQSRSSPPSVVWRARAASGDEKAAIP